MRVEGAGFMVSGVRLEVTSFELVVEVSGSGVQGSGSDGQIRVKLANSRV